MKFPASFLRGDVLNIVVGTTLSHASTPSPASAAQSDPARLKFETDMLILSPYETLSQKTKIRRVLGGLNVAAIADTVQVANTIHYCV